MIFPCDDCQEYWEERERQAQGAKEQIAILANYIIEHVPGEPSQSEGAGECAVRLLGQARAWAKLWKRAAKLQRAERKHFEILYRIETSFGVEQTRRLMQARRWAKAWKRAAKNWRAYYLARPKAEEVRHRERERCAAYLERQAEFHAPSGWTKRWHGSLEMYLKRLAAAIREEDTR